MHFGWLFLVVLPGILIWVFLGWQKLWLLPVWCAGLWAFFLLVEVWEDYRWWKFSYSGEPSIRPCPRCGGRANYRKQDRYYWVRCPICGLEEKNFSEGARGAY